MRSSVVVVVHPDTDLLFSLPKVAKRIEVNAFVLERAPQPLDEHVIHPLTFTIHRDADAVSFQNVRPLPARELTALVCVEDLRTPVALERLLQRLDAERRVLRRRQPPGE